MESSAGFIEEIEGDLISTTAPTEPKNFDLQNLRGYGPSSAHTSREDSHSHGSGCTESGRRTIYLDESEFKKLLQKVLLNRELQEKALKIRELKAQINTLAGGQRQNTTYQQGGYRYPGFSGSRIVEGDETAEDSNEYNRWVDLDNMASIVEGDGNGDGNLNDVLFNLNTQSQSLIEWVGENHEIVVQHIQTGSQIARELAVGNIAGYLTACLVKKFGKTVLCSFVGGLIFIKIAHSKGYINIDRNKVCIEIEKKAAAAELSRQMEEERINNENHSNKNLGNGGNNNNVNLNNYELDKTDAWLTKNVRSVTEWAKNNTYLASGFICGFLLKYYVTSN